jgi:hypothetical protein
MSKKISFDDWQEREWGDIDDIRKDGKRYNPKKEELNRQRQQKSKIKNKSFDLRD